MYTFIEIFYARDQESLDAKKYIQCTECQLYVSESYTRAHYGENYHCFEIIPMIAYPRSHSEY
jgi:hypothetical protein